MHLSLTEGIGGEVFFKKTKKNDFFFLNKNDIGYMYIYIFSAFLRNHNTHIYIWKTQNYAGILIHMSFVCVTISTHI